MTKKDRVQIAISIHALREEGDHPTQEKNVKR